MLSVKLLDDYIIKSQDIKTFKIQLLRDGAASAIPNGCTVTLLMANANAIVKDEQIAIIDAEQGIVQFTLHATVGTGNFDCEFIVSNGNDVNLTYPDNGYAVLKIHPCLSERPLEVVTKGEYEKLNERMDWFIAELDIFENDVSDILAGYESQFSGLQNTIDTSIAGFQDSLNRHETKLNNHSDYINAHQLKIEEHITTIADNVERLDYIQNSVTATETLADKINALPDNAGNFVEVAKVQGNTVQNIFPSNWITDSRGYYFKDVLNGYYTEMVDPNTNSSLSTSDILFKPNTTYTFIYQQYDMNTTEDLMGTIIIYPDKTDANTYTEIYLEPNIPTIFTTPATVQGIRYRGLRTKSARTTDLTGNGFRFIILEGDWTNRTDIPDYFTGIQSVQDSVQIKSIGKNWFNNTNTGKITLNGITFTNNGDSTITLNGTSTGIISANRSEWKSFLGFDGDVSKLQKNAFNLPINVDSGIYTNDNGINSAYLGIYVASGVTLSNHTINFMITLKGTTATAYEPYQETTMQIPLTEPLRAIVDTGENVVYADEIKNGKIIRKIGKKVITSDAGFTVSQYYQDDEGNYKYITLSFQDTDFLSAYSSNIYCICDKFPATFSSYVFSPSDNGIYNMIAVRRVGNQGVAIRILMSDLEAINSENPVTTTVIRQWLANQGDITVYYVKNEPITEDLPIPNDAILQTHQNGYILLENTPVRPKVDVQYAIGLQGKILKIETEIAETEDLLDNLFDAGDVEDYWNGGTV